LFQHGTRAVALPVAVHMGVLLGLGWWQRARLLATWRGREKRVLARLGLMLLVCAGLLMITPAPRYFEMVFLFFFGFIALTFGHWRFRFAAPFLFVFAGYSVTDIALNAVSERAPYIERDFRFLTLKESSYDWMPKREILEYLKAHGCRLGDLRIRDERLRVTLEALERLDYRAPLAPGGCALARNVALERGEHGPGNVVVAFPGSRIIELERR